MVVQESMTTKTLATFLIILGGISAVSAQEYQSQSTVSGQGWSRTTYEDGSSDMHTWHDNPATGQRTEDRTVRTHAVQQQAPMPTPTPEIRYYQPPKPAEVPRKEATPVVQAPVTVVAQSYAEMQAASAAGAARVKAEQETATKTHRKQ